MPADPQQSSLRGCGTSVRPGTWRSRSSGLTLVPHPRSEDCCGSAGIYNLLQPEIARRIGERKAADLQASGAAMVATGNPGCIMQIAAHLRAAGARMPVVHPVELLLPEERR